jgi:aminoglycoside 6'-N-acetyltransferase I
VTTSDVSAAACIEPLTAPSAEWLALRRALWPECPDGEHHTEMAAFSADPARYAQFMAYTGARTPAGFAEAAIRHDPVNGTSSSPVAFLEGIYVVPEERRRGIARQLFRAVLDWARGSGCTELASDALLDNEVSHAMHRALGFEETERVVCFRRSLS